MKYKNAYYSAIWMACFSMAGCAKLRAQLQHPQQHCSIMKQESWRYKVADAQNSSLKNKRSNCFAISKQQIEDTIKTNANDIWKCFRQTISTCPGKKALSLRITIDASGGVSTVSVASGTHYDTRLQQCVTHNAQQWKFKPLRHGSHYSFVYPFLMH